MQDKELLTKINNKQTVMLSLLSKEEIEKEAQKAQSALFENVEISNEELEKIDKQLNKEIDDLLTKLESELNNEV